MKGRNPSLKDSLYRSWIVLAGVALVTSTLVAIALAWLNHSYQISRVHDDLKRKAPLVARRMSGELLLGKSGAIEPVLQMLKAEKELPLIELLPEGGSCTQSGGTRPPSICAMLTDSLVWFEERIPSLGYDRRVLLAGPRPRFFSSFPISQIWIGVLPVILMSLLGIFWQRRLLRRQILTPLSNLISAGGATSEDSTWPEELRTLSTRLSRLLIERDEAVAVAHRSKAQSVLGDFVHGLLHDLKTPLATAGMIVDQAITMNPTDRDKLKTLIQRIGLIVSDHRRRIEAASAPSTPTPAYHSRDAADLSVCSVGGVLKTLAEEFVTVANRHQVNIQLSQPSEALAAFTSLSFAELSRAISNILSNAIDAQARSGGAISMFAEVAPCSIEVIIADSGSGFHPEVLQDVLKGIAKSSKPNGQGLGILSAKALVESIGGSLKIISNSGGSRVLLRLPRRKAPRWFFDPSTTSGERVVALDDDMSMLRRLKSLFPEREVMMFEREEEFLRALQNDPRALPLVDLHFGGKRDGLRLILEENLGDRAVLVSGRISFDDHVRQMAVENRLRLFPKECIV